MEQTTGSEHTRACTMCGQVFSSTLEFFYKKKGGKDGLTTACKTCHRTRQQAKPGHFLNQRRSHLKRKYGISIKEYDRMFESQGGVCGICANPADGKELCVDHDHETLEVRGLLCTTCNGAIGLLGDTAEGLRKALAYLEKT
jgi:hypothetical protein